MMMTALAQGPDRLRPRLSTYFTKIPYLTLLIVNASSKHTVCDTLSQQPILVSFFTLLFVLFVSSSLFSLRFFFPFLACVSHTFGPASATLPETSTGIAWRCGLCRFLTRSSAKDHAMMPWSHNCRSIEQLR